MKATKPKTCLMTTKLHYTLLYHKRVLTGTRANPARTPLQLHSTFHTLSVVPGTQLVSQIVKWATEMSHSVFAAMLTKSYSFISLWIVRKIVCVTCVIGKAWRSGSWACVHSSAGCFVFDYSAVYLWCSIAFCRKINCSPFLLNKPLVNITAAAVFLPKSRSIV